MIKKVNHIGFAVHSIDNTLKMLKTYFGAVELGRREYPEMGQISCLVAIGESRYELMEPLGDHGVIPKYLATHSEGFHHISLLADDLDEACRELEAAGGKIVARTDDTAFTHPKSTGGVVYEITIRDDSIAE